MRTKNLEKNNPRRNLLKVDALAAPRVFPKTNLITGLNII